MHQPYEEKTSRRADFRVRYRFYSKEEGGRDKPVFQGLRSDFWYDHENPIPGGVFIIWPEFEDASGNLILDDTIPIAQTGTARMWIINEARRPLHRERIKVGMPCYFWEGKATALCEVIEIIGLNDQ